MNNIDFYIVAAVAVMAVITALLRFLPFLIFGNNKQTPAVITYLGRVLPFAIMGMLVVYCLRNISFTGSTHGIPELVACAATALLHIWKKNSLLSIGGGTAIYMILLRVMV